MTNNKTKSISPIRPGFGGRSAHMMGMMPANIKNSKGTMKRLWHYLKRQKWQLTLVLLLVLVATILNLIGPYLIGEAIDTINVGKGQVNFQKLITIIAVMITAYTLSALMTWFQIYVMVGVAQNTVWELRTDLFAKIQTLSLRFFDSRSHGDLMSRLTNDIENINNTLSQSTTQLFSSIVTVIGALGMMLYLSPLLTVLSLVVIPLGMLLTTKITRYTRKYFGLQQKELGKLNGFIEEIISGQKVVKAFCREENSINKFIENNTRLKNAGIRAQIFSGVIMPMMNVINNLSFALVASAGGWMAVKGIITVGIIAAFLNYSRQFARPINDIANQFNMLQSALAGAERVFEVMDEVPEFQDDEENTELKNTVGDVVFKNVSFGYKKDVPVLKNINITARVGQTIALVGPTGAGKTTIVNLLSRFYDIDSGAILVDGKDIRTLKKDNLRKSLGIVLQDTYLFSDTVRENIRYGRLNATDAEVEEAATVANAEAFISRLPDGYDTVLAEDGGNLSQGQRQLLAIARAILSDPSILILDEATSSIDTRTEMHIQKAMFSLMQGRTSFVIAHRLNTIHNADQILVINEGELIEKGTHQQLLAAKGFYYNLSNSQLKRA